jgi:hypothetical protein
VVAFVIILPVGCSGDTGATVRDAAVADVETALSLAAEGPSDHSIAARLALKELESP